ncbi:signal peptidase I [Desulfovibrio sp. ZJ200]|uniref:signal peptidase I n=1 Tax=Desulfovibrio sp. ZJ200 TaxID=2709792 RepID=UPI0013EBA98E|nr:signal peptidase I [Desulfovibrio sp. ZJ200]
MKSSLLQQKTRPGKSLLREYGEALLVALILALLIRTFVVQAFKIPSESMVETLLVGDHLLASKFAYGIKIPFTDTYVYKGDEPARGDVIIFKYPNDPSVDYIKRVVGLPGDVIEVRNKQLYRNGQPVREDYIRFAQPDRIEPVRDNFGPVTVPPGKYFVMGDNRDNSMDSRFWGFVSRSAIRAKAWRIYWSWGGLDDIRWSRLGRLIQ